MEAITKHLPRRTPSTTPSMRRRSCTASTRRARCEAATVVTPPGERLTHWLISTRRHCGDLQNEQPNPALNARDRKMCYYFEPIRAAIAQPFCTRMPKDRVCKRLKQSNGEICNVKYQVQVDNNLSDEEMLAQLKKKRVKELKGILNDRGVKCEVGRLHQEDHGVERRSLEAERRRKAPKRCRDSRVALAAPRR